MYKFEVELTLLSFIWAIAVTHILQAFRDLWIARARVVPSLSHLFWMAAILVGAVLGWLPLAALHGRIADWLFGCLLLNSFAMYGAAALVSPDVGEAEPLDLVAYEEHSGSGYKLAFLVMLAIALVFNLAVYATAAAWSWVVGIVLPGIPAALTIISLWRKEIWVRTSCAGAVFVYALMLLVLNIVVN